MAGASPLHAAEKDRRADERLRRAAETGVVIYAENRSFSNLFAGFPGLAQLLAQVPPDRARQRDRVRDRWPPIWEGLVPVRQTVEHREFLIGPDDLPALPNAPFALQTINGDPLPHSVVKHDLVHSFYNNQLQINGGPQRRLRCIGR